MEVGGGGGGRESWEAGGGGWAWSVMAELRSCLGNQRAESWRGE